jgi:hypothetical protein
VPLKDKFSDLFEFCNEQTVSMAEMATEIGGSHSADGLMKDYKQNFDN